ncbi:MAG: hypothetical protein AVDCRST_MAG68-2304, partial [uncultured Gemmatimonadetes bacterium]
EERQKERRTLALGDGGTGGGRVRRVHLSHPAARRPRHRAGVLAAGSRVLAAPHRIRTRRAHGCGSGQPGASRAGRDAAARRRTGQRGGEPHPEPGRVAGGNAGGVAHPPARAGGVHHRARPRARCQARPQDGGAEGQRGTCSGLERLRGGACPREHGRGRVFQWRVQWVVRRARPRIHPEGWDVRAPAQEERTAERRAAPL